MGFGCTGGPTPTVSDPDADRKAFIKANGTNDYSSPKPLELSIAEATALADGVKAVSSGNQILMNAVFKHFTSNILGKFTSLGTVPGNPTAPGEDLNHSKEDMFTHINPEFTHVNPRLNMGDARTTYMTPLMDPKGGLGTLLIHEMLHYDGVGQGATDAEGAPYGVEYYFAKRAGIGRAGEIMDASMPWIANASSQWRFCQWCLRIRFCAGTNGVWHQGTGQHKGDCSTSFNAVQAT